MSLTTDRALQDLVGSLYLKGFYFYDSTAYYSTISIQSTICTVQLIESSGNRVCSVSLPKLH